jgi:hypothetical protein
LDGVICINVLDHPRDADLCLGEIWRVLKPGGYILLGQDLSNEEDFARYPESWSDVGHPIKLDEGALSPHLAGYEPVLNRRLPREAGRKPEAHHATLLFIGRKRLDADGGVTV